MRDLVGLAMFAAAIACGNWFRRIAKNDRSQIYPWAILILSALLMFGSLVACNWIPHIKHGIDFGTP